MAKLQATQSGKDIITYLEQHSETLKAMGVVKLGLFGSTIRGEHHAGSDLDFLLTIENWSWYRWCRVWDFLEESFDTKVDLVPASDIRPELRDKILAEARYVSLD